MNAHETGEVQLTAPVKPTPDTITDLIMHLFEFARDTGGELFLLPSAVMEGEPYIPLSFFTGDVQAMAHQVYRAMAKDWNRWIRELTEEERKEQKIKAAPTTPSEQTIRNSVSHLKALCQRTGRKVTAVLRSVQLDGGIVLDLGDDTGQVAWITAEGWEVMDPRKLPVPPPVFRRAAVQPLPAPVPGGRLEELWEILRVTDPETIALSTGWAAASLFARVSRPGLWTTGPPGSGKTTLAGGLARVTDGLEWLDGRLDRGDERNNIIRATTNYIVSFDNMTSVTSDVSDWVATLVTGHRDTYREMRTNFNAISMAYKRTFVATGLAMPFGFAADALERIIEVPCSAIPDNQRVSEEEIREALDAARPRILGGLLDHIVMVLKWLPHIPAEAKGMARMNSYAHILWAHDMAYGLGGTPCMSAYRESLSRIQEDKAEGEPVIAALLRLVQPGRYWTGTMNQLLDALAQNRLASSMTAYQGGSNRDFWPESAQRLSYKLTALDRTLAVAGIMIKRGEKTAHGRNLTITRQ